VKNCIFFLIFCCTASLSAKAQNLPKLFLVGDSISIYYTPYLERDVASEYSFGRKTSAAPESIDEQLKDPNVQGGNSQMVLDYLKMRYAQSGFAPDVVLINCGLHDIKRTPKTNAIAIDAAHYRSNLQQILGLVRSHHGKLVWVSTTPVDDKRHNSLSTEFLRYNQDVQQYNSIAKDVFSRAKVPMIDLYSFTMQLGPNHYIDHVHWDEGTRTQQAAYIAGFLAEMGGSSHAR